MHPVSGCAEAAGEAPETEPHSWTGLKKRELYPAERSCLAHPRVLPIPSSSPWEGWSRVVAWQPQQSQGNKGSAVGGAVLACEAVAGPWAMAAELQLQTGQMAKLSGARDKFHQGKE